MAQKLWLKRVLIPIWVLQLLICAILAAVSIIALYAFGQAVAQGDFDGTAGVLAALNGSVAAALALSIITILLDLLEIILLAKQKLKPAPHLGFQVVKGGAWTIWFFLVIAAYVKNQQSGFALLLAGLLCLTSVAQLVYGSVIYHRQRKGTLARGEYAPATTAQPVTQQIALEEPMFKAYQPPRADASIDIEDSARPPHRPGAYSNGVLYEE